MLTAFALSAQGPARKIALHLSDDFGARLRAAMPPEKLNVALKGWTWGSVGLEVGELEVEAFQVLDEAIRVVRCRLFLSGDGEDRLGGLRCVV